MIKFRRGCKTCEIILKEERYQGKSPLAERLYGCKEFQPNGEPLASIHRDYEDKMTYLSMRNHIKKHQNLTEELLANAKLQQLSKDVQNAKVKQLITHTDIRQAIMDTAAELLKNGELKGISATTALKAAKDTADIEEKQKDRAFEMMKMINMFASGELGREDDGRLTAPLTERLNSGL